MIHHVSRHFKHTYPQEQMYREPGREYDDFAPTYVKESELAAFFHLKPERLRQMICTAWVQVYSDPDLYTEFYFQKPQCWEDDMELRWLALERVMPMLPKRIQKRWEWVTAQLCYSEGGDYATKDATKEEIEGYQRAYERWLARGLTREERAYLKTLEYHKTIPSIATRIEEPLPLAERIAV